jgi:hypothetical protein
MEMAVADGPMKIMGLAIRYLTLYSYDALELTIGVVILERHIIS